MKFKEYYKWVFSIKGFKRIIALLCVLLVVFAVGVFMLENNAITLTIRSENSKELSQVNVAFEKEIHKIMDVARYLSTLKIKALSKKFTPEEYKEYRNLNEQISFGLMVSNAINCVSIRNSDGTVTVQSPSMDSSYSVETIRGLKSTSVKYNRNVNFLFCEEKSGIIFMEYLPNNVTATNNEILLTLDLHKLSDACIQNTTSTQKAHIIDAAGVILLSKKGSEIGKNINFLTKLDIEEIHNSDTNYYFNESGWYAAASNLSGGLISINMVEKSNYASILSVGLARSIMFCLVYLAITVVLVGLENFKYFFESNDVYTVIGNTVGYSLVMLALQVTLSVIIALLLYEVTQRALIKTYQSSILIPNFISMVLVSYIVFALLSHEYGIVNKTLESLGSQPIKWYDSPAYWKFILPIVYVWKVCGQSCIMYYAALMGIDASLYEAADIDGANRWTKTIKITIPELVPIICVVLILGVGGAMNGNFGLFFQVPRQSPALFSTTDIIATYVYRTLQNGNIGVSAAVGLFQSVAGTILVVLTNLIVKKIDPDSSMF